MLEFDPKKRYTANQLISHPFMTEPEELTDINAQQIIQDYEQFALSANFNYQLMNQQRRIDMHLDLNDERTPGQTNSYDPNRENLWQSPQVKLDPWQSKSPRLIPSPRQPPRIKTNETSAVVPESWEAWDSDS
jgi:serine/threonine protein kinase